MQLRDLQQLSAVILLCNAGRASGCFLVTLATVGRPMRATLRGLILSLCVAEMTLPALPALAQSASIEQEWRILTDAQSAYQRGNAAAERGDKDGAIREWDVATANFQQVMRMNPDTDRPVCAAGGHPHSPWPPSGRLCAAHPADARRCKRPGGSHSSRARAAGDEPSQQGHRTSRGAAQKTGQTIPMSGASCGAACRRWTERSSADAASAGLPSCRWKVGIQGSMERRCGGSMPGCCLPKPWC